MFFYALEYKMKYRFRHNQYLYFDTKILVIIIYIILI